MALAAIVVSGRARAGKTLLARLLAGNFFLSGLRPAVLDTDTAEKRLSSFFRPGARLLDLDRVAEQVALFDALLTRGPQPRVVEIAHRSTRKFIDLVRDSGYVAEARANDVEPVIFYMPSPDPDSYEYGRQLREQIPDATFAMVQNNHLGEIGHPTRLSAGYLALENIRPRIILPALDPAFIARIDDPSFSFHDFVRASKSELALAEREAIRQWLLRCFRGTYAAIEMLQSGNVAATRPLALDS